MITYQRIGAVSNAHVGRDFESAACSWFLETEGLMLTPCYTVEVGAGSTKKPRRFDLGSKSPAVIVECKSHRWTEAGNIPSAKITVWNESMYYFHIAPSDYRKILFVLKDVHSGRGESLAQFYVRNYAHMIPTDVSIVEFDESDGTATIIHAATSPK